MIATEAVQNYQDFADYLTLIASKPLDKLALVDDNCSYTYGQLAEAAAKLRQEKELCEPAIFIHADSIAQQLINFIAYSGTKTRPIIATELSKNQRFEVKIFPKTPVWV